MKLYAVTKGEYSDYYIVGLTASKEKADFLALVYSDKWAEATVEEFEDGEGCDNRLPYVVHFKNAYTVRAWLGDYSEQEESIREDKYGELIVHVMAEDKAAAVKIACDRRAKYLAEKAGLL